MAYYRLLTDEGNKKKFAYAIGLSDWPERLISCNVCKRKWKKSLMHEFGTNVLVALSNDNYPDFLWFFIRHVSEKAKNVMETEGITGFKLENAQVLSVDELTDIQKKELRYDGFKIKKIPKDPPKYYKLHVSIGANYHEKSGIILRDSCSECGYEKYVTKGKDWVESEPTVIQKDSIKGYDLFMAKGYGQTIFCTEKFADVYIKHSLTGLLFDEVEVI